MSDSTLAEIAAQAAHEVLVWVGYGTLVGLAAKAIMPGRDPGGAVATVLMGIGGSVVGCGALMFFTEVKELTPISPGGFAWATGGAVTLPVGYRLRAGPLSRE